jgi:hypothetical protein
MATEKKEVKVMGKDPVRIEWLDGSKFHKAGSFSTVHRLCAEKLVERKRAKMAK